jgi:hypothetical protein
MLPPLAPPLYKLIYIEVEPPAKQYGGKKMKCYWEHIREHIEIIMGTPWELDVNRMGIKNKIK